MKRWMGPCPALTKRGLECPNNGNVADGYLCHVHRPRRVADEVVMLGAADRRAYWKELVPCAHPGCASQIRRAHGPMCHCHGGGRRGLTLDEAMDAREREQGFSLALALKMAESDV